MTTSSMIEIDAMNLQKRVDQYEFESGELHQEIDNLNRVLREKSAYEDRLVANNSRLLERNNQLFKQVAELQSEVGNLHQQVFSLNKSLDSGKVALLEADIERLQAEVDQQKLREKELSSDNQGLKNNIAEFEAQKSNLHEVYKKDAELSQLRHANDEAEEQLAAKTAELLELSERINKLDQAYEKTVQGVKRLRRQLTETEEDNQKKSDRLAEARADLEYTQNQADEWRSRNRELQEQFGEAQKRVSLLEKSVKQLESSSHKVNELNALISEKDSELVSLRKRYELLTSEASPFHKKVDEEQNALIADLSQQVEQLNRTLSKKERLLSRLEQEKLESTSLRDDIQKQLQLEVTAKVEIQSEYRKLLQKLNEATEQITDLEKKVADNNSDATLQTKIDDLQQQLSEKSHLESEIEQLQAQLQTRETTIDSLKQQLSETSEKLVVLQTNLDKKQSSGDELSTNNTQLEQYLEDSHLKISELEEKLRSDSKINEDEIAAEIEDLKSENKSLLDRITELEQDISQRSSPEEEVEVFSAKVENLNEIISELSTKEAALSEESNELRKNAQSLRAELKLLTPRLMDQSEKKEKKRSPFWMWISIIFFCVIMILLFLLKLMPFDLSVLTPPAENKPSQEQVRTSRPTTPTNEAGAALNSDVKINKNPPAETKPYLPAKVDITTTAKTGSAPLKATFGVSLPPDTPKSLTYEWDFGDGETSKKTRPVHTFREAGVYMVRLNVQDDKRSEAKGEIEIEVKRSPEPIMSEIKTPVETELTNSKVKPTLNVSRSQGKVPLEVLFFVEGIPSSTSKISYLWDFGDGNQSITSEPPTHTYEKPGKYSAIGTIKSADEIVAELSTTIKVIPDNRGRIIQRLSASEEMILVPAGNFHLGDFRGNQDAQPQSSIFLDTYYIDKYEVTNKEYVEFLNKINYSPKENRYIDISNIACQIYYDGNSYKVESTHEYYPVVCVSWYGADAYAKHRNKRLPTEAEWEKAARGDQDVRIYCWGNQWISDGANTREFSASSGPSKVGRFPAGKSSFGCMDMIGNVSEWCSDWYNGNYYETAPAKNPQGATKGKIRSYRGGSYSDLSQHVRVFDRNGASPGAKHPTRGFRCAR